MAKSVVGPIWKFDAADQYEGWANRDEATAPIFDTVKPFIKVIQFESGATGGNYDVRESDGGRAVSGIITLGANSQYQMVVDRTLDGVYIESFGTDGQILMTAGEEG